MHLTIELTRCSAARNIRLVIIPGLPAVQRVFEITGLVERLPLSTRSPAVEMPPRARVHSV